MIPTLYGILILLIGALVGARGVVYLAVIATLFGGTAAAYVLGLGAATITPAVLALVFLAWHVARREALGGFFSPMSFLTPGFWLLVLTVWGVIAALALPRLFEGQFLVYSFDRLTDSANALRPLRPVSMNLTQAMYACLGLVTFVVMLVTVRREGGMQRFARAVLWVAGLNVIAASLDLAEHHLGMFPLLSYLKNANYAMLGGEVAGLKRIAGTFPETSVFAMYTLALLAFTHTLWMYGIHKNWARALSIANLGFLMISTAGTAYVGFAICLIVALAVSAWRFLHLGQLGPYRLYVWMALGSGILGLAVVLFVPGAWSSVSEYFNIVVGSKLDSSSGQVRMGYNAQALQTFVDTMGIGAGLGSVRASSFVLVVLSNLGWMGALFLTLFLIPVLWGRWPQSVQQEEAIIAQAGRRGVFATLVGAAVSAGVYDLGLLFYMFAAVAAAPLALSRSARGAPFAPRMLAY
ncbi:hypothetical protein GTZ97_08225 [Aquabacterium fontiphilum]|jgi:hypothetical protein|uniref:hypothetical protein n=1 Tax=Aquabacterium fontiphilum TaxID=450365 RepID=UPI00137859D3|nr:hypothetical protein [Aquabacterium fontiphilum]NBD20652.1 hypothetical protein [Aquabacterium fontiphilum]